MKQVNVKFLREGEVRFKHQLSFESLKDLCEYMFEFAYSKGFGFDVVLCFNDGKSYEWNSTMAHYCFAKGRITVDEFINIQFSKESEL